MDTLTHTVLGACLGEAIAGKQLGKKAMLAGALINNWPDVDVLFQVFLSPAQGLLAHRGITHSIFANVILTFLFSYLLWHRYRPQGLSLHQSLMLIGSGLFLHIFLDALTSYGTGWFEPFNHARVSLNVLFILDPFFMLPLLIAAIALLILKRNSQKRTAWARYGLGLSLGYLLLTFTIKAYVSHVVGNDLAQKRIPHSDYMTSPGPLNNLLWYSVVNDKDTCYVGYYSVFDALPEVDYEVIPRNDSLLTPYRNSPEIQRLVRFSQNYYRMSYEDTNLVFSDLRFGQAGGWYRKNTPFVFTFNIKGSTHAAHLQQGRFKSFAPEAMTELVKRVKGKK